MSECRSCAAAAASSHHPDEHVETADIDAGARVLLRLIENFRPREAAQ